MSLDPMTVTPDDSLRVAIERMQECNCRRLPVVEAGKLVGIVSDRDLRRATNSPFLMRERRYDEFVLDHITVRACMTANPITVTPQTSVIDAARIMHDKKFGGLPVMEGDKLVGIVTETDMLGCLIQLLNANQ